MMGYASRAGEKLEFALKSFNFDVRGLICADFGSSTGGFVDCLLQHGARKVYAVETGYGLLDWRLRNDERVVVMEKTNAVYIDLGEKIDLITIDAGWTKQSVILPSAYRNLKDNGRVISLLKLSFEVGRVIARRSRGDPGLLHFVLVPPNDKTTPSVPPNDKVNSTEQILKKITIDIANSGFTAVDSVKSPILGAKGKNIEYLYLMQKLEAYYDSLDAVEAEKLAKELKGKGYTLKEIQEKCL